MTIKAYQITAKGKNKEVVIPDVSEGLPSMAIWEIVRCYLLNATCWEIVRD